MLRRFGGNHAVVSIVLDIGLTALAFALAVALRSSLPRLLLLVPVAPEALPSPFYVVVPALWATVFLLLSLYDPSRIYRLVDELATLFVATGVASLLFAGLLYLSYHNFSRYLFLTFVLLDLLLLTAWRLLARLLFRLRYFPAAERKVLVVGAGRVGQRVGAMISQHRWMGLRLVGYLDDDQTKVGDGLPLIGRVDDVTEVIKKTGVDDVVIALPQQAYGSINQLILDLHSLPVHVRVVPDYFSLALYKATAEDFGGVPMINLREPALNDYQRLLKRLVDLALASVLFVLAAPLVGIIAVAIRLDSPGPIFFRQQRVGENGRLFRMYKFRSMVVGAEQSERFVGHVNGNGEKVYKLPDDPRATRVGRFLRRTSMDELPQLLNVLRGDMSLVGPRPELPWLAEKYEPWQRGRFAVPQGITGWWQINGRSDKPLYLHTEDDLFYVQNYSLLMDLYILMKTPLVVLRGKGAY